MSQFLLEVTPRHAAVAAQDANGKRLKVKFLRRRDRCACLLFRKSKQANGERVVSRHEL